MHIEVYPEEYLGKSHWKWFFKMTGNGHDMFSSKTFDSQIQAINNAKNCVKFILNEVDITPKFTTIKINADKKIIRWDAKT